MTYTNSTFAVGLNYVYAFKRSTFTNCEFYGMSDTAYTNTLAQYTDYINCKFFGNNCAPAGFGVTFDGCTFEATGNGQYIFSKSLSNVVIKNTPAHTPATTGWSTSALRYGFGYGFTIKDSVMTCNFGQIVAAQAGGEAVSAVGCEISNVTFNLSGVTGTDAISAPHSGTNYAWRHLIHLDRVTFSSGYAKIFNGLGTPILATNITLQGATTTLLYLDLAFNSVARGNVLNGYSAFFNNITSANSSTLLNLPTIAYAQEYYPWRVSLSNVSPATYPDRTVNPHSVMLKDPTVTRTAAYTWKFTTVFNAAHSKFHEYLLGTFNVVAGSPVIASIQTRRQTVDCRGWIVIRPLFTRTTSRDDIKAYSTAAALTWETLEVNYTPDYDGAVEVYMSMTGLANLSVWFDDFKYFQV